MRPKFNSFMKTFSAFLFFSFAIVTSSLWGQDAPRFSLSSEVACPDSTNSTVCVKVRAAKDFTDMVQVKFPIQWDTSVVEYLRVDNFQLDGLDGGSFDESLVNDGVLLLNWEPEPCETATSSVTLPDGSLLFEICFRVKGGYSDITDITIPLGESFNEDPEPVKVTRLNVGCLNIGITPIPGTISSCVRPLTVDISDESGNTDDLVCVDFTMTGFDDLSSMQFTVNWDTTVLRFEDVVPGDDLDNLSKANFGVPSEPNVGRGRLLFSWLANQLSNPAVNLADSTVVFQVCFRIIGDCETASAVEITDDGPGIEITNGVVPGVNIPLLQDEGQVEGGSCDPTGLPLIANCGDSVNLNQEVCVQVTTNDFDGIRRMRFLTEWNPNILQFKEVRNLNGNLVAFDISDFDDNNAINGVLGLDYNPNFPQDLPDGAVLYEVCFDVVGLGGNSPVQFTGSPARVVDANNNNIGINPSNCEVAVIQPEGVSMQISNAEAPPGETVCVDFSVSNFEQIDSLQFSLAWEDGLEFVDVTDIGLPGADIDNFRLDGVSSNSLSLQWSSATPVDLSNGTVIFSLCFEVTGEPDNCPLIREVPAPFSPVVTDANSNGQNIGLTTTEGEVCILQPEGYELVIGKEEGFRNDTVCVPLRVVNFENILSTEFTVNWDPSSLEFAEIRPASVLGIDDGNFDVSSAGVGVSTFSWSGGDAEALADSTVLFELCLVPTGPAGECAPINLNPDATVLTSNGEGSVQTVMGEVCIQDRLVIEEVRITNVTCPGAANGSIELTVSGGSEPVFFNWGTNPIQFNNKAINLAPGRVPVTIFDNSNPNLVLRDTFEVTMATDIPTVDAGEDQVFSCDPPISLLSGSGTTGENISVQWSTIDGTLPGDRNSLPAPAGSPGSYVLSITNEMSGCTVRDTVQVLEPERPLADAGTDLDFTCAADTIRLDGSASASGDTIAYHWTTLDGEGQIVPGEDSLVNPRITAPGQYLLEVGFTTTGCTAIDTVEVDDERIFPDAFAGPDAGLACQGASVELTGAGSNNTRDVNYRWLDTLGNQLGAGVTFNAAQLGEYILEVTDAETGCSTTDTVVVFSSDLLPTVALEENMELTCRADTLTLAAEVSDVPDDFDFQWSAAEGGNLVPGTETSLTPQIAATGVYFLQVTNPENGCQTTDSVRINEDRERPVAEAGPGFTLTCDENAFTLDGAGSTDTTGINYRWSLGGNIVAEDTLQVQISNPGTYLLEVENDRNGCTAVDSVEIEVDGELPQISTLEQPAVSCVENTATINAQIAPANADYDIQWEVLEGGAFIGATDGPSVEVDAAGAYKITVENISTGCTNENEFIVRADTVPPVANAGMDRLITCQDSVVTLNGTSSSTGSSFTYEWSALTGGMPPEPGNTLQTEVRSAGAYQLLVTNTLNGCTATDEVEVNQDTSLPSVTVAAADVITCQVSTVTLDATGSSSGDEFNVRWTDPNGQPLNPTDNPLVIEVATGGVYTLQITNSTTGCQASQMVEVTEDINLPAIDAGGNVTIECPGDTITLDGSNSASGADITYNWQVVGEQGQLSNATSVTPTVVGEGRYQLEVTNNATGCAISDTVMVALDPSIEFASAGEDQATCEETAMIFADAPANATGRWTTPTTATIENPEMASTFVSNLSGGSNLFVWTLSRPGCPDYSSDSVLVDKELRPEANNDQVVMDAGALSQVINPLSNDLINTNGPWEANLLDSTSLGSISSLGNGRFSYSVANPGIFGEEEITYELCNLTCPGLCDTAFISITVEPDPDYEPEVPNAITPNGDGMNDQLRFEQLDNDPTIWPDNHIIIFNRWGDIVYEARPYMNDWDGRNDSGEFLPDGTYYYVLRLDIAEGEILRGDVTVIKSTSPE